MGNMEYMIAATLIGSMLLLVGDSMHESDWGIWIIGAGILVLLGVVFYTINRQLS
jgi:hypothetical protein